MKRSIISMVLCFFILTALNISLNNCHHNGNGNPPFDWKVNTSQQLKNLEKRNVDLIVFYQGKFAGKTTGVIWDNDTILTAEHLLMSIPANANPKDVQLYAIFPGLQKYADLSRFPLKIVDRSSSRINGPNHLYDLLWLKMSAKPAFLLKENFKAPKLAQKINIGENVYIIGNPMTDVTEFLNVVVPAHIIKVLKSDEEFSALGIKNTEMILLDYTVVPGFSGSPIWNEKGELVGMAVVIFTSQQYGQAIFTGAVSSRTIHRFMYSNE